MRKTKIICTLGPNCRDRETLIKMFEAGMNVARLNFSHQSHDFHRENIATLKALRKELARPLALMLDTKGPEIRTGILENGIAELKTGEPFTLTTRNLTGNNTICQVSYPKLPANLSVGDCVLLDDGKITLSVKSIHETEIHCTVVSGGTLGNTRGINIPAVDIDMPFLSERDKCDLRVGIEEGVDYIAASFVRNEDDVACMREFLDQNGGTQIRIISKIENASGIENFDSILRRSDGIMVARGDMGVEIPFEWLPGIQKRLIAKCFCSGKMVITATQMLESMINSPLPTRAEINDVANAVFDSTSAVMLSGETAIGFNPPGVVEVMARICERAEADAFAFGVYKHLGSFENPKSSTNAICDATTAAAADIRADAIIAVTTNGHTARMMSKYRPDIMIIGATDNEKVFHQLSANWGVVPLLTKTQTDTDRLFSHVVERAVEEGLIHPGDRVVITSGVPLGIGGGTNTLKIVDVE